LHFCQLLSTYNVSSIYLSFCMLKVVILDFPCKRLAKLTELNLSSPLSLLD
jgi:hypothetical protein